MLRVDIGLEISFYPLQSEFRAPIHALIERLQSDGRVRVVTHSLSTQIFGDYDLVMQLVTRELCAALSNGHQAAGIIKLFGPLTS